jgi:DNA-binding HxlR family transcriptional regulator
MRLKSLADWPCSVARAMDLMGDQWSPLIMREAFLGVTRYDDFQRNLGLARNTLSARLNRLVAGGVLTKNLYQDNPPRNEYLLTDMGRDFLPVLSAIVSWGDRWLDSGQGAPMSLHHTTCGHDLGLNVICEHCGASIEQPDVEFRIGPGYPDRVEDYLDMRPRLAAPAAPAGSPGPEMPDPRRLAEQHVGNRAR